MIRMIKNNRWFLLFVIGAGLAGGYALGLWETADLDAAVQAQMAAQGMSDFQLVLITTLQAGFLYGGLLGVLGLWLSRKVGYWRPITFQPKRVGLAALLGCLVGLLLFPLDGLLFGGSTELASWSHLQPACYSICAHLISSKSEHICFLATFKLKLKRICFPAN